MKLWQKEKGLNKAIEKFTIGKDSELDLLIAEYDVIGSLAHIKMLESVGLLSKKDLALLNGELLKIHSEIKNGKFKIADGVEDIHSQIEILLTKKLGDTGKKIHTARSRNDQVLVDLRLFARNEIKEIVELTKKLFTSLVNQSEKNKNVFIPGYTHFQAAMPSSFGLWFGAYAESLVDDMILINAAYKINNQNPLGSAAGYGSSLPINRQMTTDLLGFDSLNYNSVYAQMSRGKVEKIIAFAISSVAATLSKLAMDACLFMNQNFGFVSIPDEYTTGSSIMPHKKNPDVFELIRAKCNKLQSLPNDILLMTSNLPSGYHRDFQLIKEIFLPAFSEIKSCLLMTDFVMNKITVNKNIINDKKYDFIYSVEEVNRKVAKGKPFREAYVEVTKLISDGKFRPDKKIKHIHEGSIGNLCNAQIKQKMQKTITTFSFDKTDNAIKKLLKK
ncbi:MAG: argininosuccinate lyase [Bacteroidales bacterium]|nr:argininosuccinate lyase [Bacteroidales bacterium]